jgi:hypothetical protein
MTSKQSLYISLFIFVFSIYGCSLAGRSAFLQLENDSYWHSQEYGETYSDGGRICSFTYTSDSISLKVRTDLDGIELLRQPNYLRPEVYLWGPPFIAFVPNPFSILLLFPSSVQYEYTIWIEIQSRNKLLSIKPSDILFTRKDGKQIKQKSSCFWELNRTQSKWIADSISSSFQLLNNTVAVSITLSMSDDETKGFTMRFNTLIDNVPDLVVHRNSEWFYMPLTQLH